MGYNSSSSLNEAVRFHGHLGPYLILGILAGNTAVRKLKSGKYFNLNVKVWGAYKKPKSCLIDGLQLSTGATYGKGNIEKLKGRSIRIEVTNLSNSGRIRLSLKESLVAELKAANTHRAAEVLAKKLYKIKNCAKIFKLSPVTKINNHNP